MSVSNSLKKHKKNWKSSFSVEEIAKNFQCFCEVIIEGSLLPLAFDVLLLLLPCLPASFIPLSLSAKLVQCLIDVLSTKDSWLYKVVQHFLKNLSDWVGNNDARRVSVIVALQKHSNGEGPRALPNFLEPNDVGSYFIRFLSTLCNIPSNSLFRPLETEEEDTEKIASNGNFTFKSGTYCGLFRFMSVPIHFEFQAFPDLLDSPGEDGLDADDAPAVIMDVFVDTLLSLLPQSSAPMRTSIELV
ncbi:hypothetical protein GBA52_016455 [Prunus armeniaca]|nr:hypothetical protein GBA52_016455 [Prunus armeniaca]